jgi:hypothetical protein
MSTESATPARANGPPRRTLLAAFAVSAAGTAVLGGPLYFLVAHNMWWIAVSSVPALVAAGFFLGWRAGEPEPLDGSILSAAYFGVVAIVLFGGVWVGTFPDPMPGLATGDSTFFFVWPLMILAAGVAGSISGGRIVARLRPRP